MDYRNWTEEQKTAHILEALSREELSAELLVLIQGWMLDSEGVADREKVLDGILDRMFAGDHPPGRRTYESLARLHERIGLSGVEMPATKRVRLRWTLFGVAAAVIPLLVLAGALWLGRERVPDQEVPAVSAVAEVLPNEAGMVALPDGSTVRLSGGSRMTVAENFAENRFVKLSGEAFFSVARDDERPFIVETDRLTVTVLGTEFNLQAHPEKGETVVSLASGRVEIRDDKGSVVLAPMEQLVYDKRTGESVVAEFTPALIDRWRFGRQELDDVSLPQALRAVGDFYGKKVVIEGSLPPGLGVTTVLKETASVESVLEAIRLMNSVFTYTITEDIIYIGKK